VFSSQSPLFPAFRFAAGNRKYYYNTVTRETSWTDPRGGAGTTDGEWKERSDPQTNKIYYFNTATRETSWTKPEGFKETEKKVAPAATSMKGDLDSVATNAGAASKLKKLNTAAIAEQKKETKKEKMKHKRQSIVEHGHTMEIYAKTHFNFNRKGLMKAETTTEKMLKWKADMIKTAMCKLPDDLSNEACQAYKNILSYMGDRKSKKEPIAHAKKLLEQCILLPDDLIDEVYVQLCKQSTGNPRPEGMHRCFELFVIFLSTIPPSKVFSPYLENYLATHLGGEDETLEKYANYCIDKLPRAMGLGRRAEVPTTSELECVRALKPVIHRISFLDGTFKSMAIESWTTTKDLEELIAEKLHINNPLPFALFEWSTEDEERVLEPTERILDLAATWSQIMDKERKKRGKNAAVEEFKLIYKVRLFLQTEEDDTQAIALMHIQAVHDVVDSRYPCSEQDNITLAALQIQVRLLYSSTTLLVYLSSTLLHYSEILYSEILLPTHACAPLFKPLSS
jgi:hypothetical protein